MKARIIEVGCGSGWKQYSEQLKGREIEIIEIRGSYFNYSILVIKPIVIDGKNIRKIACKYEQIDREKIEFRWGK